MSEIMMPCSYEAEQAVLGGLMLDNDRWDEVILQISPEDLFSRPHRMVFRVMAELAGEGLPLDLITITERLENRGDLEQCGGFAYLAEMSKNTPSAANILAYAGVVAEKSRLRQLMTVGNSLLSDVQAPKASSAGILESAEGKLFNIAEQGARNYTRLDEKGCGYYKIDLGPFWRLLSRNEGRTWLLLSHERYNSAIRK